MKTSARKLASLFAVVIAMAVVGPAYAGEVCDPPGKCNSGRGNLSEGNPNQLINPHIGGTGPGIVGTVDCDPGNSGGVNRGGD